MEQSAPTVEILAVVGEDDDLTAAVRDACGEVAPPEDADAIVTVGQAALLEVARSGFDLPVLPVGVDDSHHAVSRPDGRRAIQAVLAGESRRITHPLLGIDVAGDRVGRALLDVTLVTGQPARISEYTVQHEGALLDSVRADGVVVATPAGSDGSAGATGGPVLEAGTGLVVAPIAPFTTQSDTWVVPDGVTLTVARDDDPVDLVIDDRVYGSVDPFEPIEVTVAGGIDLLSVSLSEP